MLATVRAGHVRFGWSLAVVALAASLVFAACADEPSPIDDWLGRIDGHTIRYTETLLCGFGGFLPCGGGWAITEADGTIIDAEVIEEPTPDFLEPLSLASALQLAARATGDVDISTTADSIELDVDPNADAIDDGFILRATGITIEP